MVTGYTGNLPKTIGCQTTPNITHLMSLFLGSWTKSHNKADSRQRIRRLSSNIHFTTQWPLSCCCGESITKGDRDLGHFLNGPRMGELLSMNKVPLQSNCIEYLESLEND